MNGIMTDADFRKSLRGSLEGVYFFYGEEDYLKAHALQGARQALCPDPSLEFFNNVKIDCSDFDPSALANALPTMPVMADKKLIELTGLNFSALKKAQEDELLASLRVAEEYDFNVIIIVASADGFDEGRPPKQPSADLKKISAVAQPVRFPRSTPAMLARWAQKHFEHNGVSAELSVCTEFVDFCGKDMYILASEIDKLSCYLLANGKSDVSRADIPEICIPDTGYDNFAFANAISDRRRADALEILWEMRRRKIEPTIIMGEIIKTFEEMLRIRLLSDDGASPRDISARLRVHEYRVSLYLSTKITADRLRELLTMCAETDLILKSSSQNYMPIERLICSI